MIQLRAMSDKLQFVAGSVSDAFTGTTDKLQFVGHSSPSFPVEPPLSPARFLLKRFAKSTKPFIIRPMGRSHSQLKRSLAKIPPGSFRLHLFAF